ncbi:MAG: ATP F0F1 synthase subunit B, partial [Alphaproteobacteria bacterium]
MMTETFWVAVSLIIFLFVLWYIRAPGMLTKRLDDRARKIREELDNARKLREDAQAVLAQYQRKQRAAEKEAEEIVIRAREEAEHSAEEARKALKEQMERRFRLAEEKIAQAEAQALSEVRRTAANVAVAAARKMIASRLTEADSARLIDNGIDEVGRKLH